MFKNPGRKLKSLAKFFFAIGILFDVLISLTVIFGTTYITEFTDATSGTPIEGTAAASPNAMLVLGIVLFIVLFFCTWISSLAVYGWGDLIESNETMKDEVTELRSSLAAGIPLQQMPLPADAIPQDLTAEAGKPEAPQA